MQNHHVRPLRIRLNGLSKVDLMKKCLFLVIVIFSNSCSEKLEEVIPVEEPAPFESLRVVIDWDNTFEYEGIQYTYCATMDIDVLVYNEFNQEVTDFAAARSNCPEEFELTAAVDNGKYTIYLNAYNHLELSRFGIDPLNVPVSIFLSRNEKEHVSIIDTISTNDSIWQIRDQRPVYIEAGIITKTDIGFEWQVAGEEKVIF